MNDRRREKLVKVLKALANPIRLRMIASLYEEPKHVYALAKELGIPYPLAYLHLKGLRKLGLVKEVREEERVGGMPTVKYYAPSEFEFVLSPKSIWDVFSGKGGEEDG
ncbi:winged helix-turn-helix transcriptional regulator [Candidatus Bathyarchaeota archaeon]|nr:winged helix-turn-helix transcriptional regulator [Candidatus Bathyarchaeota archaeon]